MRAAYACHPNRSRGRRFPEPPAPTRSEFQRDRDRIVHSTAFRRLVYKTQVFLNHEGDLFRTRLTHSLEVAQLGRSIARSLGLDEDLIETIALAHDLGHTPFGHAGQDVLDDCMKDYGGFEHNLQSLRVVDLLEQRYPAFDGLNLSFESREGILKHCSRRNAQAIEAVEPDGIAARFLNGGQPSLEAQLCNLADEVAYNAHDIDDGVRSGLVTLEQLEAVPLVQRYLREALAEYPQLVGKRLLAETIRRMLSNQVYDIIDASRTRLEEAAPADVEAVRTADAPLLRFSKEMRSASTELKRFLFANLYRHPQVAQTRTRAEQVLRDLFSLYMTDPAQMPEEFSAAPDKPRAVADYIAGMTDRYAIKEHQRLTGQQLIQV
ncbi:deoxyguanosinetriphosphate triphosphohydrolase [Pelomonas sp. SE-A7]|uniref:deoxyguanosinetriphosphate triphosphohydrolase n=1 Tax=Pelomonas sp. SE-A7 TaxID=3054953 RepID=UPI00259CF4CC|nr:deoxyguanosinetriphosphate triphosphohydrolase [Pelomonas sp. SE-A7]MDM4767720.1 deoxyguanosinetriphosphate triphosphohydrolase [Pelomonas sp. SE-A7]